MIYAIKDVLVLSSPKFVMNFVSKNLQLLIEPSSNVKYRVVAFPSNVKEKSDILDLHVVNLLILKTTQIV